MKGSKFRIWKQDPWTPHIDIRTTFVHSRLSAGPSDAEIRVEMPEGVPLVEPDKNGNFLFCPKKEMEKFNAAHTFAVARQVLTMYQRAIGRAGYRRPFEWQWGKIPLILKPHAPKSTSPVTPSYHRSSRSVEFPFFESNVVYQPEDEGRGTEKKETIYTCQSFDFIAHEMGHAILDALKPCYHDTNSKETMKLAESFGDLTAIFTVAGQMDQVEAVIAESKADIREPTFLSAIAERYGLVTEGKWRGLRDALNEHLVTNNLGSLHANSQSFTGAVYEILAEIFDDHVLLDQYDPAESLYRVGQHMALVVLRAFIDAPDVNPSFRNIAEMMMRAEDHPRWRNSMKWVFEKREILTP